MGILEMIPSEYWRQLYEELKTLNFEEEDKAKEEAAAQERERRIKVLDEVIKRKQAEKQAVRDKMRYQRNKNKQSV